MFIERSAGRIRLTRLIFVVAGLVPCLLLAGWAVHRGSTAHRDAVRAAWQAAVDGRWKAIRRAAGPKQLAVPGPVELYDLAADPAETTNVAARHPQVVKRMTEILDSEHVPDPAWPLPFADAASQAVSANGSSRPAAEFLYPVANVPAVGR